MARCITASSTARGGMTLIELLVSLGVLAVISIAFATILSQSQRVVARSNALMQANAAASAVSQVLRDDLASLATQGFLAVYQDSEQTPHLIFTTFGPFTSRTTTGVTANAARIDYGWTDNGTPDDPEDDTLWRRAILLTGTTLGTVDSDETDDQDEEAWLGIYDPASAAVPIVVDQTRVDTYCEGPTIPTEVTAGNVDELWPLLARPCTDFKVSWWDATSGWVPCDSANPMWLWTAAEFRDPGSAAVPPPSAIKVNFRLKTGPKEQEYLDYEVICPIRP